MTIWPITLPLPLRNVGPSTTAQLTKSIDPAMIKLSRTARNRPAIRVGADGNASIAAMARSTPAR